MYLESNLLIKDYVRMIYHGYLSWDKRRDDRSARFVKILSS